MSYIKQLIILIRNNDKLFLILLCGLVLRLWGLKGSLPINYADEEVYVVGALRVGQGDFNPHSFINPSLMIYVNFLLFGCYFLAGKFLSIFNSLNDFKNLFYADPTSFYLLARFMMVLFGILSIVVLYYIVRLCYDKKKALTAALLLAIYPAHIYASQSAKCDVAMVFLVLLSLLFLLRYYQENRKVFFYLGCFLCGLAVSTKYTAAPLSITCMITYLLKSKFSVHKADSIAMLKGILLMLTGFLLTTPFAALDYSAFYADILFLSNRNTLPWFGMEGKSGLWEYPLKAFPRVSGWTIYVCAILGAIVRRRHISSREVIIFSFPLFLFILLAQTYNVGWNYVLPIHPFFCIMAAFFISGFFAHIKSSMARNALIIIIVAPPLIMGIVNGHNRSTVDTRLLAKDWIEKNVAPDNKIAAEGFGVLIPNRQRIQEILQGIKNPIRGGQFKYYLEHPYEKSFYIYDFALFACESGDKELTDEQQRRCATPNIADYDFNKIKDKYDYIVLSSIVYSRFEAFSHLYQQQNEFYNILRKNGIIIKVFNNYCDQEKDDNMLFIRKFFKYIGVVDYQGPNISIYKL